MCTSSPKVSSPEPVKVPEPAPAAPTPEPTAEAPVVDEGSKRTGSRGTEGNTSRTGTGALRIDINLAQPSSGGLNIPRG